MHYVCVIASNPVWRTFPASSTCPLTKPPPFIARSCLAILEEVILPPASEFLHGPIPSLLGAILWWVRKRLLLLLGACVLMAPAHAQRRLETPAGQTVEQGQLRRYHRRHDASRRSPFDERLRPFYHGVASGDPLPDRVILWTRVTPEEEAQVEVAWRIATDPELVEVVAGGTSMTDAGRDYTVKIDASGLLPGTTYYYGFTALGRHSITGRTRTAPLGGVARLRFAVVACANYQQGFFNGYARLAERADLDAVLHLGDYIYEYEEGGFGYSDEVGRGHEPEHEILDLDDYRIRHSFYKLDPDLRRAHQQHPFIAVWDDHETANNSWPDGAQNHQPNEGRWEDRKAGALKAYFEWMPVRPADPLDDTRIFRSIRYGDLAELFMLDTRLAGRQQQLDDSPLDSSALFDPARTLLGASQYEWLTAQLAASTARWKIIGNQVLMGQLTGFTNLDAWDGYPAERDRLLAFLEAQEMDNTVVVTGDIHTTWVGDLARDPFDPTGYDETTGAGALAVEFVTPSISSANFDELFGGPSDFLEGLLLGVHPHFKQIELDSHGYFILDLGAEAAQADWFYVNIYDETDERETFAGGWLTRSGMNHVEAAEAPAPTKSNAPAFAPEDPPISTAMEIAPGQLARGELLVVGVYPNPAVHSASLHFALRRPEHVRVSLYDAIGREVARLLDAPQPAGVYTFTFDVSSLAAGVYFTHVQAGKQIVVRNLIVR